MALEPINLNALRRERKARQAASGGPDPYVFIWGPEPQKPEDPTNRFTIPAEVDWPDSVGEPFEEGDLPKAFRILLGEEQWAAMHAHSPVEIGDWIDLEAWLSAQQGIKSQGEGQAPAGSSNGTAPSSKETSSATTESTSPKRSPRVKDS